MRLAKILYVDASLNYIDGSNDGRLERVNEIGRLILYWIGSFAPTLVDYSQHAQCETHFFQ